MSVEQDEKYMLRSAKEILALLHAIQRSNALITAHFDHGKYSMLTAILDVRESDNSMLLDYGVNKHLNRRMVAGGKVLFDTIHNRIKVQFSAPNIVKTRFENQDAFRMKIPASLLRIQKRDYYRADTPMTQPLQCIVPARDNEQSEDTHLDHPVWEVSLENISIGGICIVGFPEQAVITQGMVFEGCRIVLPKTGKIIVDMEIVNTDDAKVKMRGKTKRYGCKFINIDEVVQSMIQHYIIKLDREKINKGIS